MNKLREDLSIGLLGAAAGLFSSSITLLIERIDAYYVYLSTGDAEFYYHRGIRDLWWIAPSFWHIVLSVVAACLVHRYLKSHLKSPFLLWQVVGITSLLGWGLTFFVWFSLLCVISGDLDSLYLVTAEDLLNVAKFASAVFACNVMYGSVINAGSQQYPEQIDSEALY